MSPRVPTEQRAAAELEGDLPPDEVTVCALRKRLDVIDGKVDALTTTIDQRVLPFADHIAGDVRVIREQVRALINLPYPEPARRARLPWRVVIGALALLSSSALGAVIHYLVTRS